MLETKNNKHASVIEETKLSPGLLTRRAITETAHEIGGPDLVEEVSAKFTGEELLRDDPALHHLENLESGAIYRVKVKADQMLQETGNLEASETGKSFFIKLGSSVMKLIRRK